MRMAKRPNLDFVTLEACLAGQICRESGSDRAPSMLCFKRTNILRWAPVREDHDLDVRVFEVRDLRIEPGKIPFMRVVMHANIPVASVVKVVEPERNGGVVLRRNRREEAAAQNGNVRVWQPERSAVEQDKVSKRLVLSDVLFEGEKDIESGRPVGMIRFMIARDEEYGAEIIELQG